MQLVALSSSGSVSCPLCSLPVRSAQISFALVQTGSSRPFLSVASSHVPSQFSHPHVSRSPNTTYNFFTTSFMAYQAEGTRRQVVAASELTHVLTNQLSHVCRLSSQ